MKNHRRFALSGLACAALLPCQSLVAATIYQVNDWYASQAHATGVSNGNSSSATVQYDGSDKGPSSYVWGYFAPDASPIQLTDGQTLTLSTQITIEYVSAASAKSELRFGLYNSGATRATTDPGSYGASRVSTSLANAYRGWTGFFTSSLASAGTGALYRQVTSNAYPTAGSAASVSMTDEALQQTYTSGAPVSLTLSLTRSGDDLAFSGVYGSDAFSGTYANAFNGYADTFNAIGFFVGTPGFGANLDSITFANTTVTLVPEPTATAAMALVAGGGLLLHLKQRRKAAVAR